MPSVRRRGFTLIELLLAVAIIVLLATIVLTAINPPRNIAQANNAQRRSDVKTILDAVQQYAVDNTGILPTTITTVSSEICKTSAASCSGLIDLSVVTFEERYVLRMPTDPTSATTYGTGYYIYKDAYGRLTVTAPFAQLGATISVSR